MAMIQTLELTNKGFKMKFELDIHDYREICENALHSNYRYRESEILEQNFFDAVLENEIDNWYNGGMNPLHIDNYILYEMSYYDLEEFVAENWDEIKEYLEDEGYDEDSPEYNYMLETGDYGIAWNKIEKIIDREGFIYYEDFGVIVTN